MTDKSNRYNRPRQPEPSYTHELHAQRCGEAARHRQVLIQHVLAKRGPIIYCAVIKAPWTSPSGIDCWTVETSWPEKTRLTIPVRNVIQCGGDTCTCTDEAIALALACASRDRASEAPHEARLEQAFPDPEFSQAGVVAPPDSLTHETLPVSSTPAF